MADNSSYVLMNVLRVLSEHKLLDATGHIPNCGYTENHPICGCENLGRDLHNAIKDMKPWGKRRTRR